MINYISSTEAVCVFPRQTLVDRESLIADNRDSVSDNDDWIEKYAARGFNVLGHGRIPMDFVLGK